MGLESVYKLSVIVNMIDSLTNPMKKMASESTNALDKLTGKFASLTGAGAALTALGSSMTGLTLNTVESTFDTQDALGELKSLGIEDLTAVEDAARQFSDTWGGTVKSDFISAAYDIKSGISSLSDEGVAQFTNLAALTGKATKSSADEMTSLFATGYNIYKGNYEDMSDLEFGEMFSAGISTAVQVYKTKGSEMAAAIESLGASASSAQVPLEEQLSILGMLQATMSGSEAGTKYQAFVSAAASAGETLKLSFTDANNQILSMPEILAQLKGKYGDTIDAIEKQELASAFGTDEAVDVINLLYGKTDTLQSNILNMYDSLGQGTAVATEMATAINSTDSQKYQVLKQRIQNVKEELGTALIPTVMEFMNKEESMLTKLSDWISKNQDTVTTIMKVVLFLGILLTVLGSTVITIGVFGITITKTIGYAKDFTGFIKNIPDLLTTLRIKAMYAGDGISSAFSTIKTAGKNVITTIGNVSKAVLDFAKRAVISGITAAKNFVISMASMAKQAIITAVTALPGLISAVWSFTAALLANPVTWIVIAIIALIVALVALWKNWDKVSTFISGVWKSVVSVVSSGLNALGKKITAIPQFFTGLGSKISTIVGGAIKQVKEKITGSFASFRESGSKILTTFTEGIKSAISNPVDAVKGALSKIRKMLPFSDAKEGPLSTLTLSGKRVFETINTGMTQTADLPAKTTSKAFSKVATELTKTNTDGNEKKQVKLPQKDDTTSKSISQDKKGNQTIIQKLELTVDITKLKDLPLLFKLVDEIKNANNGTDTEYAT